MIYLPVGRDAIDDRLTDDEVRNLVLPAELPTLRRHLEHFKPLLVHKVEGYGERRPWWTIHRARPEIANRDRPKQTWAEYCLTARWGPGSRLVVGLAPSATVPASGLHALLPPADVSASYVVALLNSTPVQDLAETLPPGQIRRDDIRSLGLPVLAEGGDQVSAAGIELADLVRQMIVGYLGRFRRLGDHLRDDLTLDVVPDDAWLPGTGGEAHWGTLSSVNWVSAIERRGPPNSTIADVSVERGLFGVRVVGAGLKSASITLELAEDDDAVNEALSSLLMGMAAAGISFRDVPTCPVPIDAAKLVAQRSSDVAELSALVAQYRSLRASVDEIVETAL